jgi:hypothetical protein
VVQKSNIFEVIENFQPFLAGFAISSHDFNYGKAQKIKIDRAQVKFSD